MRGELVLEGLTAAVAGGVEIRENSRDEVDGIGRGTPVEGHVELRLALLDKEHPEGGAEPRSRTICFVGILLLDQLHLCAAGDRRYRRTQRYNQRQLREAVRVGEGERVDPVKALGCRRRRQGI